MSDTEHEGVSPASAGGAPASGRWRTGNRNPRNLYWTRPDATDEHRGVMFDPADGPFAVEALNARLLAVEAEYSAKTGPVDRKPVYSEPGVDTDWDEDADAMLIHGVGWNLSWGCKLSIARDHDTGEHYVCVNTSGEDQRKGIVSRSTTREQIASFGQQLLNVFGEPDPRDAEIERLRAELDGQRADKEQAEAAHDRLRQRLDQHLADENSAQAANDRLRDEIQNLNAGHDGAMRYITNRLSDILNANTTDIYELLNMASLRVEGGDDASAELKRHELRPTFQPGQRVRVGDCAGTVHEAHDITRVKLDGVPIAHDFETRFVRPTPYDEEVPF